MRDTVSVLPPLFCRWKLVRSPFRHGNLNRFFPGGSDGKESACNPGDLGLIPGSRRSPGKGNGNPLKYSCLENPMDRGAWQGTVDGSHEELDTTE